jgi:hypothetical protein
VTVRFDQGDLVDYLQAVPRAYVQLTGHVTTNVSGIDERGVGRPGLGGFESQFTKRIIRRGFPIGRPQMAQLYQELEMGFPEAKIRDLRLLVACLPELGMKSRIVPDAAGRDAGNQADAPDAPAPAPAGAGGDQPDQPTAAQQLLGDMFNHLVTATEDEVPGVAEWAKFELARVVGPDKAQAPVGALIADKRWEARLLGLIATQALQRDLATEIATNLAEHDSDELVKAFAAEQVELLRHAPATQPTTQPAPDAAAAPAPEAQTK